MNIVFDATILTSILTKNAARSGIFFAAYNIFSCMIKQPGVNIYLYSAPFCYIDFKTFQQNYCPNIPDLYKSGFIDFLFKSYLRLKETHKNIYHHLFFRKIVAMGILFIRASIRITSPLYVDYKRINSCDVFFSPALKIPSKVNKKVLKTIFLYDAIPLKFPQYDPKGSFLKKIQRNGSSS